MTCIRHSSEQPCMSSALLLPFTFHYFRSIQLVPAIIPIRSVMQRSESPTCCPHKKDALCRTVNHLRNYIKKPEGLLFHLFFFYNQSTSLPPILFLTQAHSDKAECFVCCHKRVKNRLNMCQNMFPVKGKETMRHCRQLLSASRSVAVAAAAAS